MSDMFEYLEAQARENDAPFVNATSVAVDRAERRFASFLSAAKGNKEFNSRVDLLSNDIHKIAVDVCEEYGYSDSEHVANIVIGQLQMISDRNSDSSKTDSIGEIKREKLDSQDPSGYYTEPSPKLNPGSAGDNMHNTNPSISELKPDDRQHPDDLSYPNDGSLPKANLVNADKPMQPENHVGDSTMTFGDGNQAEPVTASKKKSNHLGEDHAGEWEYPNQSMDKIRKRFREGASMEDIKREFADFIQQNSLNTNDLYQIGVDPKIGAVSDVDDVDDVDSFIDELIEKSIHEESDTNYSSEMMKSAAERMDFNSFAEMMTPSEAINELVGSGMPKHEAKDRIDFYVNHVNPGWASKHWTSAAEDSIEQPAMRNEIPATEGAGKWRAPQTDMEKFLIEQKQKEFERSIVEEVSRMIQEVLAGKDKDHPMGDKETGAEYTYQQLADSGQLDEIYRGFIMSNSPGAGVKGISLTTGQPHIVPITKKNDMNFAQQKDTEEKQRKIPGVGGGVTIGDRALERKSEGAEPYGRSGPMGGPTGL